MTINEINKSRKADMITSDKLTETINAIIAKIRTILGHNPSYEEIVSRTPQVNISYDVDSGMYNIESVKFIDWDSVEACSFGCHYHPEHGSPECLIKYSSFDELIKL